ncbi:hypothetical protein Tco_0152253 [Tanacetum coccineum]
MAALKYREEHNKVGYLEKPKGSDDYHQVLDFLRGSHFRYALTHDPIIFDSLVKQFWSTASLRAPELGSPAILATIDRTPYTITEDTVRRQLQLGDDGGIEDLPIADIYLGMDNLGYPTEGKLTFYKNKFSPQWRFLVHTLQHCLSSKSGSWDQFGSPLAIALICLSDGRRFNWSRYIFKGIVHNISNAKRFLMYPRFLQIILGIETRNTKQYHVLKLSSKLFANMRLNFNGDHMPLLAAMLPPAQAAIADEGAHESDPDLFTSTNVEDETLGGSFHTTPPTSTQVPPDGPTLGGAEDLATLTALSSLVSELVQKVSTLKSELQAHKLLFKDVVGTLVKKVKALELKLNTRSMKVVMSESDKEEEEEQDVDPLIKLAKAVAASDAHVDVSPGVDIPPGLPLSTEFPTKVPSDGAPTGPSTISPSSTTVPTSSYVPAAAAGSRTTPETPSSHLKLLHHLSEMQEREKLARQISQDFEMTEDQRKRQQEVLVSAANYSDAAWDLILARDPEAEHKVCIKYASDADSASDDDTPVNLYVVVDWELLPTRLGSINAFYRLDNSRKYFTSLREILHLVTRAAEGVGLVLWGDLKVLMDSLEVNDELSSICQPYRKDARSSAGDLSRNSGNELTTAVQLIAFLKKQISDSKRPKVHEWYC